ncbi:MAG: hypothetical protein A2355_09880 [Spirochaetes bacterium RIFOXYB1_FULL_32_8]|nr:MAG: hypothetical protein A2355_09880 [Spirochaetes bacterium RIFOXYB1_FULL_32_8]
MELTSVHDNKLSNLQLELLKLFSYGVNDDDLKVIKNFLTKYFAEKAMDEADRFWNEKDFKSANDMEKWLNE